MFIFFPSDRQAFGWAMLAVALVSAIGGVWYALAQHEMKRLLAYHSVENIGIIGLHHPAGLPFGPGPLFTNPRCT
jgi:formate hydrogenlyase subunit 3/multisubunit Na+/H+ antiporter MnhD subunit